MRALALVLLLPSIVFAQPPDVLADIEYLRQFVRSDPEADARASFQKGRPSFLATAGYVLSVPGIEAAGFQGCVAASEEAVDVIRGTSDFVWGAEHVALIDAARQYAARYNRAMAGHRAYKLPPVCGPR